MGITLSRINSILSSRRLFWAIFGLFVFGAVWIVLSAVYPQAFDEDFHFGLIKVYSHYWLPFLSGQPPNANAYGAVARDPSYLYHYLMSFPYRFIALFTHDQTDQIIILRLINVAFFGSGILVFRKVLQRAKLSGALVNMILLVFMLIPIASQLAAHINYDNLLFLLVAWVALLSFQIIDELRAKKPNTRTLCILVTVCLLTSLVKYAFLPIFFGVVLYLTYFTYKTFKGSFKTLWTRLAKSWRAQPTWLKPLLVAMVAISLGMFAQRDIVNLVEYHSITPNCNAVLSTNQCKAYSAWYYSYTSHIQLEATKSSNPGTLTYYNPFTYMGVWLYWMWYRLFFAINGPASGFTNYPPLPLPSAAAAILGIVGIIVVVLWRRSIFLNNPYLRFFFIISITYIAALWIDGYTDYRYTHVLQAMNGRYLLPVLLPAAAIFGRAFSLWLRDRPTRKTVLAVVVALLFLQGGGVLTFIARSDSSWYWPNNSVVKVNDVAKKITRPVIIKGRKTYSSSFWFYN